MKKIDYEKYLCNSTGIDSSDRKIFIKKEDMEKRADKRRKFYKTYKKYDNVDFNCVNVLTTDYGNFRVMFI